MKEGRYCTVRWTAVNQIKLVSVRKGTVVKVFQAWWTEVGSIEPQSRPETWENAHTPTTLTLQKSKYIYTHVQANPGATTYSMRVYKKQMWFPIEQSSVLFEKKQKPISHSGIW